MVPLFVNSVLHCCSTKFLLRTRSDVTTDSGELVLDYVAECWHRGYEGQSHCSGNESVLNCSCARFVVHEAYKLVHLILQIYSTAPSSSVRGFMHRLREP